MQEKKELLQRKPTRLQNYNYNSDGYYFITVCTDKKRKILSQIVGGDVLDAPKNVLFQYGIIADKYIKQLNDFYKNISVDSYVIMPNHIHIILSVSSGASRTSPPTTKDAQSAVTNGQIVCTSKQHSCVSQFVSTLKRFCNKEYGENIWQRHFYDHIIRNREDYEEHLKYINDNPARWYYDELNEE